MGKMAAAKIDVGDEKKDIGYLVMMLVGIGNSLESSWDGRKVEETLKRKIGYWCDAGRER